MKRLLVRIALYVAIIGALAVCRWRLWTYGTDTGTFSQVVASGFGGFLDGPEQGTHFRFHWAPLLVVLQPLVLATRSALSLQLAQIVLCACTALPLYGIARAYVDERAARRYATLALLYPPLAGTAFTEFHEIAFFPALALGCVWAAQTRRPRAFVALATAAALVREEACITLVLAGLGLVALAIVAARRPAGAGPGGLLFGRPADPRALALQGGFLAVASVIALGVYYGLVIPRVGSWAPSRFYDFPFAFGPAALVRDLFAHPADLRTFLTPGRAGYLLEAFVPLALLPLRSAWTLAAVPGLLVVLLSSDPIAWRMGSHYPAVWVPWLLLATLHALVRADLARPPAARTARPRAYVAAAALSVVFLIAINPMHVGHYLRPYVPHAGVAAAFRLVDPQAYVATHDEWFAHEALAHRNATVFFCPFVTDAVYEDDFPNAYFQERIKPELAREVASGRARVRARFGPIAVYVRRPDPGARVGGCDTGAILPPRGAPERLLGK